jgi:hypothetical protein
VKQARADSVLPTDEFPITFTTLAIDTGSKLVLIGPATPSALALRPWPTTSTT